MAPAGYFLLPLQNKTDEPEGQGHRTAKTNKKQTNSRTSQPPKDTRGEGGCHGGKVCVYWWGRQHSAILSHLSWLTTGTATKHTNKTRKETKKQQKRQQETRTAKIHHIKTELRAIITLVWTGTRREKASGGQQQQEGEGAREGSKGQERRKQHGPGRWAHAALTVSRGGFWITRKRIPQCRKEKHLNNTRNMV